MLRAGGVSRFPVPVGANPATAPTARSSLAIADVGVAPATVWPIWIRYVERTGGRRRHALRQPRGRTPVPGDRRPEACRRRSVAAVVHARLAALSGDRAAAARGSVDATGRYGGGAVGHGPHRCDETPSGGEPPTAAVRQGPPLFLAPPLVLTDTLDAGPTPAFSESLCEIWKGPSRASTPRGRRP